MAETKLYVGAKIIRAIPMDNRAFHREMGKSMAENTDNMAGYKVIYPDGYVSWSPKETFETAYREVTESERGLLE